MKRTVRLIVEPPKGNAENAILNWVDNHQEWQNDPTAHRITDANAETTDTTYTSAVFRFYQEETATDLLDDLEARLQSIQGGLWYRIGYHECGHDEPGRSSCSWTETREYGAIPSDVPQI